MRLYKTRAAPHRPHSLPPRRGAHLCFVQNSQSLSGEPFTGMAGVRGVYATLLVAVLVVLLVADSTLAQTFSYSRGWKSGKRAGPGTATVTVGGTGPSPGSPGGRTTEEILAEDLPLYRYFLEGRGEHRVPFDPWRLGEEPVVHFARRPAPQQGDDQAGEHEDR